MPASHRENNNNKANTICNLALGSKFYVFAKKPVFPYSKELAYNYYKMLVVIEMVPPTNVSFPIINLTP